MTATKANPKKAPNTSPLSPIDQVRAELDDARKELSLVNRFLEKLQTFSTVVGDAKEELKTLQAEENGLVISLRDLRGEIKSIKALIDSSNHGLLSLIEPGPLNFMPLFDLMEKSSPEKHGTNAGKWREQPLSLLKLSPASTAVLYEAEILFIGQLQDRVIEDPDTWWSDIAGLTLPIAAAIADKLSDFSKKGGDV